MATAVLHPHGIFAPGVSCKAYALNDQPGKNIPVGAPRGTAAATATVDTDGSLTFTGLTAGVEYLAWGDVGGSVTFATGTAGGAGGGAEVQTVTITGGSAGTFKLSFGGEESAGIAYNASAATLVAALEALTAIGTGGVTAVVSTPSGQRVWTVTFAAALESVPLLTANTASLTATSLAIAQVTEGLNISDEQETITVVATSGTYTLTYSGQTTGAIAFDAAGSAVQTALEALSNIAPGDVFVEGPKKGVDDHVYALQFAGALKNTDITLTATATGLVLDRYVNFQV